MTLARMIKGARRRAPAPLKDVIWYLKRNPAVTSNLVVHRASMVIVRWRIRQSRGKPPFVVRVETTNRCNARCRTCPQPNIGRPAQVMDQALFERVARECAEAGVQNVQLNCNNEPLMDKQIVDKVRYLKQAGIRSVRIISNGMLLDQHRADDLLASGIDAVALSIDGFDKETYESRRIGLSFDTVISNALYLLERRADLRVAKPRVLVTAFLGEGLMRQDARRSPVYQRLNRLADHIALHESKEAHDWAGQMGESAGHRQFRGRFRRRPCRMLWSTMSVHADGSVPLCCLDYSGRVNLGNLGESKLINIWAGAAYEAIRGFHLRGMQDRVELCRDCPESASWSWITQLKDVGD